MSSGRIIAAAIVGGILMFFWGFVSHEVLPIGTMGMKSLPTDDKFMPQFKAAIPERGLYIFPGIDFANITPEVLKAHEEKSRNNPNGLLIIDPAGCGDMMPTQLATEGLSNIFACLLAAIILSRVPGSWMSRALLSAGMGLLAWLSIDVSYWNWYHFPTMFAVGEMIDQTAGWFIAGIGMALVLRTKRTTAVGV